MKRIYFRETQEQIINQCQPEAETLQLNYYLLVKNKYSLFFATNISEVTCYAAIVDWWLNTDDRPGPSLSLLSLTIPGILASSPVFDILNLFLLHDP